jgi:hypothetical protein
VTNFFTDTDLSGAGEFLESGVTLTLSDEFTLPACTINWIRSRFPAIAGGALPKPRIYDATDTAIFSAATFDTSTDDAWNQATVGQSVSAGTYRVAQVVLSRYMAKSGFYSGGAVTRGSITANRGMFTTGDAAPTSASTASYLMDVDITTGGSAITIIDLASGPRFRSAMETTVFGAALADPPSSARWRSGVEAAVLGVAVSDFAGRALARSADGAGVVSGFAAGDLPGGLRVRSAVETILTGVGVGDTPGRVLARSATESVAIGTLLPVTFADAIAGMRARSGRETILTPAPTPITDVPPIIVPVRRVRAEPRVRRGTYIVKVEEVTNATD